MSEFGQQIIFSQLLHKHDRVEIPKLQRDYAQGREAVAELRVEFLNALYSALNLPSDDVKLPLNLDFIYGSVESSDATCFLPLDGQQRLTTLFLLHWYTSWRDDSGPDFRTLLCPDGFSRFSYSIRPSSVEFFNALVCFEPSVEPDEVSLLSDLISNQSWYFRHWRLDPTIQSCLKVLDSIHKRFCKSNGMYSRLIDEKNPAITFQLLDLDNFGLSDDLYIKMNARGKPLTPFETFKARYEQELEKIFPDKTKEIGNEKFSAAEFFSRRMDTAWADFFWAHRDTETNLYDDAVMNLFRVIILVTRDTAQASYIGNVTALRKISLTPSFSLFSDSDWLDRDFSENLILLLEAWSVNGDILATQLPDNTYFDEIAVFKKAVSQPASFGYGEIVQFAAYLSFLKLHEGGIDADIFQEWMRVVSNLTTNTSYDRAFDMQRSISGIVSIVPNSSEVLTYFAESQKPLSGFSSQQVQEEKLKAELILAHEDWRTLIVRAEGHGYFKGQIEFLLDFSGVLKKWQVEGMDWNSEEHKHLQGEFERYLSIAEHMFTESGLTRQADFRWERAFLTLGNYLLPSGGLNLCFLVNSAQEKASWKRLLKGSGSVGSDKRGMLKRFMDRLLSSNKISQQLDDIIASASNLAPWRMVLIGHPHAIQYCQRRLIRWNTGNNIYLLSKSQMNGAHAELFTYCLYPQLFADNNLGKFSPLRLADYYYSSETGVEPGIRFNWAGLDDSKCFELEWTKGSFRIYLVLGLEEPQPAYVPYLVTNAGFEVVGNLLVKKCEHKEIGDIVQKLRCNLEKYTESEEDNE